MASMIYKTPKGRITRKVFLYFGAIPFFGVMLISIFLAAAVGLSDKEISRMLVFMVLVFIYPWAMVCIKRFHDVGFPGWAFAAMLVPYLNTITLIFLACYPGEKGDNKYGPDPKRPRVGKPEEA